MALPTNISKGDLLKAIEKVDNEGIPKDGDSKYYDLIFNGKRYPPKLIVSYANIFSNGEELDRNTFKGGLDTECFNLLKTNGFIIVEKNYNHQSFYPELNNFIKQSHTSNLTTGNFIKTFLDLSVKVSFGQGNSARVPWIAFLSEADEVQNGIYPVYLYYKNQNLLILAYGLSEKTKPNRNWNISEALTIKEYFSRNQLGNPDRYGNSFVFKVYRTNNKLDETQINSDLFEVISFYKQTLNSPTLKPKSNLEFDCNEFLKSAAEAGYFIQKNLCTRFCASLLTKPFVILTGLSGSGKTKLAQAFAKWISESERQYRIIPVGADWTNREPLLGFPNALEPNKYVEPDSGVLKLIIQANESPDLPHFLILDEMNLSHVERYFADFLSVMESKDSITLYPEDSIIENIPARLIIPNNLFIIGTVNIDETTNMFSPKVLDRANTIEFRILDEEMISFLKSAKTLNLDSLKGKGSQMGKGFLAMSSNENSVPEELGYIGTELVKFFNELKIVSAEFGFRTATEILTLIRNLTILDSTLSTSSKIDVAIIQKLLPKLHGSKRKLCSVLEILGSLCLNEKEEMKVALAKDGYEMNSTQIVYPLSFDKIRRMYRSALDNGYTSFAEA